MTRIPAFDRMLKFGLEVGAIQSFTAWMREKRNIHLRYLTGEAPKEHLEELIAEWLGIDHAMLESERRWVLRQVSKDRHEGG